MYFTSLSLKRFRNYRSLILNPSRGSTVLFGANGVGKTNILEAMHLLSLGRSHRTAADKEMVRDGEDMASVCGITMRQDGRHEVEVRLSPFEKPRKRILLFGKPAERIADMMGHATCIMFAPEDIRIVRDGPAARRRFVDMQISQIRPDYVRALRTYLSVLESRNALLKGQRKMSREGFEAQLDTWDEQLSAAAVPVTAARRWFLEALSQSASVQYAAIAECAEETFEMRYAGPLARETKPYEAMLAGLKRTRAEDIYRQYTSFGPQRDDLALLLCGKELRAFGSQGQLRTAVLSLKLGEIALIERELGEPPALLLDDVFSELDGKRRDALLRSAEGLQTFITCTDRQDAAGAKAEVFLRVRQNADGSAGMEEA